MRDLESKHSIRFHETEELVSSKESSLTRLIEVKDEKLNDILHRGINDINSFVKNVADELHAKRTELNAKYTGKFSKVKDVIAKYFEKYDIDMEELKINMRILNQKYADWSKVLIEPTSLNEARLYALETRLHEEEDIRIKE
jgi:phenylalanyl-tRNA synthetase alpha subunit